LDKIFAWWLVLGSKQFSLLPQLPQKIDALLKNSKNRFGNNNLALLT